MFTKFWDSVVQKSIEAVVAAVLVAITAALGAGVVALQYAHIPWFWRRFAMAGVATLTYYAFIRFAPRWAVPRIQGNQPNVRIWAEFDNDLLFLGIRNNGPADEFVASVTLIGGIMLPWPVFPVHLRWRRHGTEKREIFKGATQHLEVLRVTLQPEQADERDRQFGPIHLLSLGHETEVQPQWLYASRLAHPLEFNITLRAVKQELEKAISLDAHLAIAGREVSRTAAIVAE